VSPDTGEDFPSDELTERLSRVLAERAGSVRASDDAWSRVQRATAAERGRRHRRLRLVIGVPAGAVGLAAAALVGVLVIRSGGFGAARTSSTAFSAAAGPAAGGASSGAPVHPGAFAPDSGSSSAVASVGAASPAAGPARPVPSGFRALSATFVSLDHGWLLGTAPCPGPPATASGGTSSAAAPSGAAPGAGCSWVLTTTDGGRSWSAVGRPPTSRVRSVRFADPSNGFVFGPELWATHDGGVSWSPVTLPGLTTAQPEVDAVEAGAGRVHAVVVDGPVVRIYDADPGGSAWTAAGLTLDTGAGPVPSAQLVLAGSSGWVLENDRTVVGGARLAAGRWTAWTPPCTQVAGPAVLAAASPTDLLAVCDVGRWATPEGEQLYVSHDGGGTFGAGRPVPVEGVTGLAASAATVVVSGFSTGTDGLARPTLELSGDGGAAWRTVYSGVGNGDWADVGFTTPTRGVVVADGTLLVSSDGGRTWSLRPAGG